MDNLSCGSGKIPLAAAQPQPMAGALHWPASLALKTGVFKTFLAVWKISKKVCKRAVPWMAKQMKGCVFVKGAPLGKCHSENM